MAEILVVLLAICGAMVVGAFTAILIWAVWGLIFGE